MKSITVFTPSYNRAFCLHECYESLINQTNSDFKWLIIDDGSTDNTQELASKWIEENLIDIEYRYKENGGVHTAYNLAFDLITTELNVCIDSDDSMPHNAIEQILMKWDSVPDKTGIAGLIGLDIFKNGEFVGNKFPEGLEKATWGDLYNKYGVKGDKKLVYRTDVVNEFARFPVFKGEYFVPHSTLYMQIDTKYELLCLNEVLCIVEYLEDGYSRNMYEHYFRHPKGFQYSRLITLQYSKHFKLKFRHAIHYVAKSIKLKDKSFLKKSPEKLLTLAAIPAGTILYAYLKYKNRHLSKR